MSQRIKKPLPPKISAHFIEPMILLRTEVLPDDPSLWLYEIKHDGYRAVAFQTGGKLHLRSRNDNDFAVQYPAIANALSALPNETVVDGGIVASDTDGKPSFNLLQSHGSSGIPLVYYIVDVMVVGGKDVKGEPLDRCQQILQQKILPKLDEPIRYVGELGAALPDLL